MKPLNTKILLVMLLSVIGAKVLAQEYVIDFAVEYDDGSKFWFSYINEGKDLGIVMGGGSESGILNIPEEVSYMNRTRKVTAICKKAFIDNTYISSVNIPNSVNDIGDYAFYGCSGLSSLTIPNSVKTIGESAFAYCKGLTSLTKESMVLLFGAVNLLTPFI